MEMREEILNQGEEASYADHRRRMLVKELLDSFYSVTVAPAFEKDAVIGAALRTSLELRILVQKKQVHLSESRGFPGTEEPSSDFLHMTTGLTDFQLAAPSSSRTAANNHSSAKHILAHLHLSAHYSTSSPDSKPNPNDFVNSLANVYSNTQIHDNS
ncbi:hypothetical protein Aperf_G00000099058 [Anoplocephala perfoliata]